ncbi:MAG: hypothetical protein KatS3mg050_0825 [Litorilinea sp.]|nr:MAG: hypothetical protein KatS3mg050_0825 [Litorilinea sp.]
MPYQRIILRTGLFVLVLLWGLSGYLALQARQADIPTGTIAYFKNQTELHLVNSNGSNDRVIWTNPRPMSPFFSATIDWRPDGGELAFQSGHELPCSTYSDDIWAIRPDGSHLRRVTNGPDCATLASRATGSVSVTILNSNLSYSTYLLYVEGASEARPFTLSPGFQQTITIDNVADFGPGVGQVVTVYSGDNARSWLYGATADVQPGGTVQVGGVFELDAGVPRFTAEQPAFRHDGAQLVFLLGGAPYLIADAPPERDQGTGLTFDNQVPLSYVDFSPVSNQLLGIFDDGISTHFLRIDAGNGQVAEFFDDDSGIVQGISWLPDGSGFVYSITGNFGANANLFRYDITSGVKTQITAVEDGVAAVDPSVSPDGGWVAFTRLVNDPNAAPEVWTVAMDGSQAQLLASEAAFPAWGPDMSAQPPTATPAPPEPTPTSPGPTATPLPPSGESHAIYLPYVERH